MEPVVTWKVSGLDELQKSLEQLSKNIGKNGVRKALNAGGEVIRDAIVELAPEDTGFMKEHFDKRVSMRNDALAGSVFIGPAGKIDYPKGIVAKAEFYALLLGKKLSKKALNAIGRVSVMSVVRFFEFGTVKMTAKPFMTQGFEGSQHKAVDAVADSLRETIVKETR